MAKYAKALEVAQIGKETTPGTAVAANRRLPNLRLGIGMDGDANEDFMGSGNLYPSDLTNSVEWGGGSYEVPPTFVEQVYINDSLFKTATPVGAGAAKTRTYTPSVSAADTFTTYTFQKGQAGSIVQHPYGVFNSWSQTIKKQGRNLISGDLLSQEGTPGTALSGSPTVVTSRPIPNTSWNLYTGTSWSNLQSAASALNTGFQLDIAYGPRYDSEFFVGSAEPSFDDLGIIVPNNEIKLTLPKNASGSDFAEYVTMAKKRGGTFIYLRASALGNVVETGTPDILEESTIDMSLKVRAVPAESEMNVFLGLQWTLGLFIDPTPTKALEWKIVNNLTAV